MVLKPSELAPLSSMILTEMIDEAKIWIESVIDSQREDGYFGPEPYVEGTLDLRTQKIDQKKRKEILSRIRFNKN